MNNECLQDLKRNLCECRFNRSDFMHQQWLNAINDLQQENKELHNKIDKAIEYIENADWYLPLWEIRDNQPDKNILLEILKDSDVDECE